MTQTIDVECAVQVRDLRVTRSGNTVFDGLHFDVPRGQVTGLLGPSGCGKSTLLRAIVGVQRIRGGTVTVLGSPAGSRALRSRVAYDTQAASVYDDLTVQQNLEYFASIIGAGKDAVQRTLAQVGLTAHTHTLVARLSGGQRGRTSLAIALVGSPDLIVLDEPTVGLDPVLRRELWELFRTIADEGTTLLVSSHVMDEALRCDRLALLREGVLIAETTPDSLLSETGTTTPDAAFLALVTEIHARASSAGPSESP